MFSRILSIWLTSWVFFFSLAKVFPAFRIPSRVWSSSFPCTTTTLTRYFVKNSVPGMRRKVEMISSLVSAYKLALADISSAYEWVLLLTIDNVTLHVLFESIGQCELNFSIIFFGYSRCFSKIVQYLYDISTSLLWTLYLTQRIIFILRQLRDVLEKILMGWCNFMEWDDDNRLSLLCHFHVLINLW
jgi:hypothetical protein